MKTNSEKWEHYKSIVDKRRTEFIDVVLGDSKPAEYWFFTHWSKDICRATITKWLYLDGFEEARALGLYTSKKTREHVAAMKALADRQECLNAENIRLSFKEKSDHGTIIGQKTLGQIVQDHTSDLTKEGAEKKRSELRKKYDLKDGQIACWYCRTPVDEGTSFSNRVISIANYGPYGKVFKYCSSKCASRDQMAHEG